MLWVGELAVPFLPFSLFFSIFVTWVKAGRWNRGNPLNFELVRQELLISFFFFFFC